MTSQPEPQKKRRGRPKKEIVSPVSEEKGIVSAPSSDQYIIEVEYAKHTMFKKILQLYKQYEVGEIEMNFGPTDIKMISTDHLGRTCIYATIDGASMGSYYCESPTRIIVPVDRVEKIIAKLGKNHKDISIIMKADNKSKIYIVVRDIEYSGEHTYTIDAVCKQEPTHQPIVDNDENYPVKFVMGATHFKTIINQIKCLSNTFTIQLPGKGPLHFTHDGDQRWTAIYADSSAISLKSTLAEDEILSASVSIDNIKPITSVAVGSEIYFAIDKYKKMSFTIFIDSITRNGVIISSAAKIKVFIALKDYS